MELGPVDVFGKRSHEIAPEEALGTLPNVVIDFVCLDKICSNIMAGALPLN
jgi:hypothetical protein